MYELEAGACDKCVTKEWTGRLMTLCWFVFGVSGWILAPWMAYMAVRAHLMSPYPNGPLDAELLYGLVGFWSCVLLIVFAKYKDHGPIRAFAKLFGREVVYACLDEKDRLHIHQDLASAYKVICELRAYDGEYHTAVLMISPSGLFSRYRLWWNPAMVGPENCWRCVRSSSSDRYTIKVRDNGGGELQSDLWTILRFINGFRDVHTAGEEAVKAPKRLEGLAWTVLGGVASCRRCRVESPHIERGQSLILHALARAGISCEVVNRWADLMPSSSLARDGGEDLAEAIGSVRTDFHTAFNDCQAAEDV